MKKTTFLVKNITKLFVKKNKLFCKKTNIFLVVKKQTFFSVKKHKLFGNRGLTLCKIAEIMAESVSEIEELSQSSNSSKSALICMNWCVKCEFTISVVRCANFCEISGMLRKMCSSVFVNTK